MSRNIRKFNLSLLTYGLGITFLTSLSIKYATEMQKKHITKKIAPGNHNTYVYFEEGLRQDISHR